jgi:hypothetical protein
MSRLKLHDRTYEDNDGTWTTVEFHYCHPWENGAPADVSATVEIFERKDDGGFDWNHPSSTQCFNLDEMNATLLHGFLSAALRLMPIQWAQYQEEERRKANPPK